MKKRIIYIIVTVFFTSMVLFSCDSLLNTEPADDEVLDGLVEGLTHEQKLLHILGDVAFNDDVFTRETGLGPIFVASSCGSCHAGDGKGHPFTTLVRFGQADSTGNKFLNMGGPQLQNRALPGFEPEQIPSGAPFASFMPPINTGLGFIELVSDEDILAMSDPEDKDGDGISGIPNWNTVPAYVSIRDGAISNNGKYICRFGKKAPVYDLLQQTVNAYNQDIGITSVFNPIDVYTHKEIDPEVSNATIHNVVFYLQTLKAPVQRNQSDPQIIAGNEIFRKIKCNGCHKAELKTTVSKITALSNKTFKPYTDLLLHDMGSELDDGYTEGSARTYEWRTAPLWGLGLAPKSQGGKYFLLHDGRAKSIEEAIKYHGGEAKPSKDLFNQLSEEEKKNLIKFLESL